MRGNTRLQGKLFEWKSKLYSIRKNTNAQVSVGDGANFTLGAPDCLGHFAEKGTGRGARQEATEETREKA